MNSQQDFEPVKERVTFTSVFEEDTDKSPSLPNDQRTEDERVMMELDRYVDQLEKNQDRPKPSGEDSHLSPTTGEDSHLSPTTGEDSHLSPTTGEDSHLSPTTGEDSHLSPTTGADSHLSRGMGIRSPLSGHLKILEPLEDPEDSLAEDAFLQFPPSPSIVDKDPITGEKGAVNSGQVNNENIDVSMRDSSLLDIVTPNPATYVDMNLMSSHSSSSLGKRKIEDALETLNGPGRFWNPTSLPSPPRHAHSHAHSHSHRDKVEPKSSNRNSKRTRDLAALKDLPTTKKLYGFDRCFQCQVDGREVCFVAKGKKLCVCCNNRCSFSLTAWQQRMLSDQAAQYQSADQLGRFLRDNKAAYESCEEMKERCVVACLPYGGLRINGIRIDPKKDIDWSSG